MEREVREESRGPVFFFFPFFFDVGALGGGARLLSSLSLSLFQNQEETHHSGGLGGVLRELERDLDVGLRAEVVDLVGLGRAVFFFRVFFWSWSREKEEEKKWVNFLSFSVSCRRRRRRFRATRTRSLEKITIFPPQNRLPSSPSPLSFLSPEQLAERAKVDQVGVVEEEALRAGVACIFYSLNCGEQKKKGSLSFAPYSGPPKQKQKTHSNP